MKNKIIITLLILLPAISFAQPTLNNVMPVIGDSFPIYNPTYTIPLSFPKTGNQNWDFSSYAQTPPDLIVRVESPAATPYPTDFPTADACIAIYTPSSSSAQVYLFAKYTADSVWSLGSRSAIPIFNFAYIDPAVGYRFPFNLNDVMYDTEEDTNGDKDTTQEKYVAWGTIITPYGTYSNVILKEVSSMFNGNWELDSYQWVSVTDLMEVATIEAYDSVVTWQAGNISTAIQETELMKKFDFTIYPQPSTGSINMKYDLPTTENVRIDIICLNGQSSFVLLNEKQTAGTHLINLENRLHAGGTYFARVSIGSAVFSQQFIIAP